MRVFRGRLSQPRHDAHSAHPAGSISSSGRETQVPAAARARQPPPRSSTFLVVGDLDLIHQVSLPAPFRFLPDPWRASGARVESRVPLRMLPYCKRRGRADIRLAVFSTR